MSAQDTDHGPLPDQRGGKSGPAIFTFGLGTHPDRAQAFPKLMNLRFRAMHT